MDSLILPVVNSSAMGIFLEEVSKRHSDKTIVMFGDGASWHTSDKLIIPHNIVFLKLPPYSPELNPTEHIWDELREKWFHNHAFDSMEAVETQLLNGLSSLEGNTELVKSNTGFDWIVSVV
jgi:transposase